MRISDWSSDVCSSDLMGALMARRSVRILVEDFVKAGGGFRTLAVDAPRSERASLAGISANGESLQAGQYVFACGPWLPKLFPEAVGGRIGPTGQGVFHFSPETGDVAFAHLLLPAWVGSRDP